MPRDFAFHPTVQGVPLSGDVLPEDTYAEADPLTDWPEGISIMPVSAEEGWMGLDVDPGHVTTYRTATSSSQTFEFVDHDTAPHRFARFWISAEITGSEPAWGNWNEIATTFYIDQAVNNVIKIVPLAANFYTEAAAITSYYAGLTVMPVDAGNDWGPNTGEAGRITTSNDGTNGDQVFRANNGNSYKRTYTSGAWGSWTAFSMEGHTHTGYVATTDYDDADVLAKVKNVDGSGSGLDADLLDGHDTAYFAVSGAAPTAHAASHTNGTDDIQNATSAQKGLATAAQITKLDGIESGATADMTASEILTALLTVDTDNSGLNADTLDGVQGSGYTPIAHVGAGGTAHANAVAAGAAGFLTGSDKTKLDGIETGATADQTAAEILTAVKTVDGTGSGLDADLLDGHDTAFFAAAGAAPTAHAASHTNGTDDIQNATSAQKGLATAAQITKLDGIETAATADMTASEILTALLTVDGTGSLLDADKLDGQEGTYYTNASNLASGTVPTGRLGSGTADATTVLYGNNTWAAPPGASGGLTLTEVEIDLGSTPVTSGSFQLTGLSGLTTGRHVLIRQALGPYTNKGTLADEYEMDTIQVAGKVASASTIQCYWSTDSFVRGNFKFAYAVG